MSQQQIHHRDSQQVFIKPQNISGAPTISSPISSFNYWLTKNKYYHDRMAQWYRLVIPAGMNVLHVGCQNGYLLKALNPLVGIGVEADVQEREYAKIQYTDMQFCSVISDVPAQIPIDYIVLSCVTLHTYDIQQLFIDLHRLCTPHTKIVLDTYSYMWEPVLWLTAKLGLRRPTHFLNWVTARGIIQIASLAGFECVVHERGMIMPLGIPGVAWFCNNLLALLPGIRTLALNHYMILRSRNDIRALSATASIIIPCKNERGNIEHAVLRCPNMGASTEIIFVEGGSRDGTAQEIERVIAAYPEKNIRCFTQSGRGKGDAVRLGFAHARGDVLMIQDGDLTAPPEELPHFFHALVTGTGDFINGSRLVYGMESGAMGMHSVCANYFFGTFVSWIIGQRVKDTLCGTKVLFKRDYELIALNRTLFGALDPFGDFDLLFGAARLGMKIVDVPVHYKPRIYGQTNINRFYDGWRLFFMCIKAFTIFKWRWSKHG
jgi:hypothetical protein